jgi:hypothetical protein
MHEGLESVFQWWLWLWLLNGGLTCSFNKFLQCIFQWRFLRKRIIWWRMEELVSELRIIRMVQFIKLWQQKISTTISHGLSLPREIRMVANKSWNLLLCFYVLFYFHVLIENKFKTSDLDLKIHQWWFLSFPEFNCSYQLDNQPRQIDRLYNRSIEIHQSKKNRSCDMRSSDTGQ